MSTRRSGRKSTVQVRVYDDLSRLRRDAQTWGGGNVERAVGVAQDRRVISDGGEREFFYIRLWRGALGVGVITHEITHIAARIYYNHVAPEHGHPDADIDNEETLCHLVGDLAAKIVSKLYTRQVFDP